MHDSDDEDNIKLYTDLLSKYGLDPRALDWAGAESQNLRFRVLSEIGNLNGARVLDVGCGLGDMYAWLRKNRIEIEYTGIDITPKMIEIAQQRFPGCTFRHSDFAAFVETNDAGFDYVFASGIFCKRQNKPFDFLKRTAETMFALCKKGVSFNSLSAWTDEQDTGEFHANPLETLEFCRGITPWVCLRHDYHLRDFTIYMNHARN